MTQRLKLGIPFPSCLLRAALCLRLLRASIPLATIVAATTIGTLAIFLLRFLFLLGDLFFRRLLLFLGLSFLLDYSIVFKHRTIRSLHIFTFLVVLEEIPIAGIVREGKRHVGLICR